MRFRPKFTLRTLLIATVLLGLFFGWLTSAMVRIHHQRRVVAQLQALGGRVQYDWRMKNGESFLRSPHGWKPFRWLFGDDAFSTVTVVYGLQPGGMSDRDLPLLLELPELEEFGVVGPGITDDGMPSIAQIKKLRSLTLQDNAVSQAAFDALRQMPGLEELRLFGDWITNEHLKAIEGLTNLRQMELVSRNIGAAGLRSIGTFSSLRSLHMTRIPGIVDDGLEAIGALSHLEFLRLDCSGINDEGLRRLAGLPELKTLVIGDEGCASASITEAGVLSLAALPKLKVLHLYTGGVTDASAPALAKLAHLQSLDLSRTKVTDDAMPEISKLTSLRYLGLNGTKISDAGLLQLTPLVNLKRLIVGPDITRPAAEQLKQAIPKCAIECFDANGKLVFKLE